MFCNQSGTSQLFIGLAVTISLFVVVEFAKSQPQPTTQAAEGGGQHEQDGVSIEQPPPYILMSKLGSVSRLTPWPFQPSSSPVELLRSGGEGLGYHYRLGRMFWRDTFAGRIMSASLDGTSGPTVAVDRIGFEGDLTVDWINDKLYWTERSERRLREYDIITGHQRTVFDTGSGSLPTSVIVYPYPGYGWLYWTDPAKETIERVSVSGDGHKVIIRDLGRSCLGPLTLDYLTHTVYWIDNCEFNIHSVSISGNRLVFNPLIARPDRVTAQTLALYEDIVYWSVRENVFGFNRSSSVHAQSVYSGSGRSTITGLQLVHPSKQPSGEVFVEMIVGNDSTSCSVECVNGRCIPPGLCGCNRGWIGENCTTDHNECEVGNGGCESLCVNIIGGYYCSCNGIIGYTLDPTNGTDCIDVNECETSNGGCEHRCHNTEGSFECLCFNGFTLSSNGFNCSRLASYVVMPESTSVHTISVMPTFNSDTLLAMSTRHQLLTMGGSSPSSIHQHTTTPAQAQTASATFGKVPVVTTSIAGAYSTFSEPIPVPSSSNSAAQAHSTSSEPIPVPSSSISSSPVTTVVIPVVMTSISTISHSTPPVPISSTSQPRPTSTPTLISFPLSSSQVSYSSHDRTSPSSLSARSSLLVAQATTPGSISSQSISLENSDMPTLTPTSSPSPQIPPLPTDIIVDSPGSAPLVVVISGSAVGGAALIVLVVLIVVVAFGCYVKQSHKGSYNFNRGTQTAAVTEPASLRGSKRKTESADYKTSFWLERSNGNGLGSSHSNGLGSSHSNGLGSSHSPNVNLYV